MLSAQLGDDLGRPRRRSSASAYIVVDRPRVCISTSAAPRLGRRRRASAGSYRRPLTSLTIAAPASSAARATAAL